MLWDGVSKKSYSTTEKMEKEFLNASNSLNWSLNRFMHYTVDMYCQTTTVDQNTQQVHLL